MRCKKHCCALKQRGLAYHVKTVILCYTYVMKLYRRLWLALPGFLLVPLVCNAALVISTGTSATFWEIVSRILTALSYMIIPIAAALFMIGALMITVSGIKEDYRQTGKNLIFGSIISLAVVSGAYAMLRMVDYFLVV